MSDAQDKVYSIPKATTQRTVKKLAANPEHVAIANDLARMAKESKRSYAAAEAGRLLGSFTGSQAHINDELLNAKRLMTARSRELYQNNAHVQNYFQILETNVVGKDGFKFKPNTGQYVKGVFQPFAAQNDLVSKHWARWCAFGIADATGRHSFNSLLALIVSTVARDGEALVLKHRVKPTRKNPYGFMIQLVNIDKLDIQHNVAEDKNGVSIVMGVEIDKYSRPIAYHLNHDLGKQNTSRAKQVRERVLAEDAYHVYAQEHAEQVRGTPWLHSVVIPLHQLESFEQYTLVAARIGASKMGFFTRDDTTGAGAEALADGEDENGDLVLEAEPGMFQVLPPGFDFKPFTPDYPAQTFSEFVKSIKRSVSNGLRLCYNTLFGDLEQVNYSSIRQALIAERAMYETLHAWLIETFVQPVYEDWIKTSMLNGALVDTSGYVLPDLALEAFLNDYNFKGRSWSWVDPKNDLEAAKIAKDIGIYSPARIAEMMGEDIWVMMSETAAIRDEAKRLNIYIDHVNDPEANAQAQALVDAAAAQAEANIAVAAAQAAKSLTAIDDLKEEVKAVFNALESVRAVPKTEQVQPQINLNVHLTETKQLVKEEVKAEVIDEPLPIIEEVKELKDAPVIALEPEPVVEPLEVIAELKELELIPEEQTDIELLIVSVEELVEELEEAADGS